MHQSKFQSRMRGIWGAFTPLFVRSCIRGEPAEVRRWYRKGCPAPAPGYIKRKILEEYARFYHPAIFIETGTYMGETPYALHSLFKQLYTIELSQELFLAAQKRLAPLANVKQYQGDSAIALGEILKGINEPCLFWLDGHYSGGITAKGGKECPLLEELSHIWRHPVKQHIILLDDARHFGVKPDYPTLDELVELGRREGYDSELQYDTLSLIPKGANKIGPTLKNLLE